MTYKELSRYQYIVGYGVGQYYERKKLLIPAYASFSYLCDMRWEQIGEEYDGKKVISPDELKKMENVFVIVFSGTEGTWQSITEMLESERIPYAHAQTIIQKNVISGKELKEMEREVYTDEFGNMIEFFPDIAENLEIEFTGGQNKVKVGKDVRVRGNLHIRCGNNAICSIGHGTAIGNVNILVSNGSIVIGDDCLFSGGILLRNHDGHSIFDKDSQKRINYAGNLKIGDHVWVGRGVTLLKNTVIGNGSVVGTMAVTSSSFPREVVIAGNPAKVIRENICWSKDRTDYFDRDSLEECIDKGASRYF